jgi:TPP-dependent pyruvate/acetoin dehydrogenase alpha subunit
LPQQIKADVDAAAKRAHGGHQPPAAELYSDIYSGPDVRP